MILTQREPHFVAPGTADFRRRLLLVSYHFPPSPATGALRWQKFGAVGAERGYGLDVIAQDPARLRIQDASRLADLPAGTRVFGINAMTTRTERILHGTDAVLARIRRVRQNGAAPRSNGSAAASPLEEVNAAGVLSEVQVGGWSAHPRKVLKALRAWRYLDADNGWRLAAIETGTAVAEQVAPDIIVSCGPPHAAHRAAAVIARRTGIPLVIDLRDPWGQASLVQEYCASPLFFETLRRREKNVVDLASLVVVNTETHAQTLRRVYPYAADRIICVLNGCDVEALPARPSAAERFTIAYAGNIYIDRDPRPLFRAAARVVREKRLTPDRFAIEFIGDVSQFAGRSITELAAQSGLDGFVAVYPRRPQAEVRAYLAGVPMLLSLPQSAHLSLPSKIFEYMNFEAWILALATAATATEHALRGTGADVVDPSDEAGIARVIGDRIDRFMNGEKPARLIDQNPHLTRRRQADLLFDAIDHVLAKRAAP